jgi:flavin-dependent dehydrogenase
VVGADGCHSTVARAVGAPLVEVAPATRAIYYRYVAGFAGPNGFPSDGAEFSQLGDEMAYALPSDAGLTCIALSVNLETFAWLRQDPETRFRARLAEHACLADRIADADEVSPLLACGPRPNYVRMPFGPGWALVGDAGLYQDPWSGQGMDMAAIHATYLSEALDAGLAAGDLDGALATYHRRRDEHALETYRHTVDVGADLRQLPRIWGFDESRVERRASGIESR